MNDAALIESLLANPLATVADYYASRLAGNDKAVAFVREQLKLTMEQAAEQRVGFADRSLGTQLPHKRIKSGRAVRELLESFGIYKRNGRETLRGCVTVPVTDESGDTVALTGYRIDSVNGDPIIVPVRTGCAPGQRDPGCGDAAPADQPGDEELTTNEESSTNKKSSTNDTTSSPEPIADDELILDENQVLFHREDRHYRIRGLEKNASTSTLKVALMVSRDSLVHLDSLDLVKAASRTSFIKAAAAELYVDEETIKRDVGRLLLKLESLQAEQLSELKRPQAVELTEAERDEALELLRDPSLLDRIVADLDACGIVGERTGKLAGYLAAVSRKLDKPLAIVIQSSSSAGKTSLMDAILAMVPAEDQLRLSNLTGQSLYYLDSADIRHKILAVSEGEGISQATYALKLLQSEGVLRHATVGKGENGRMTTHHYTVEGPVSLFLTTTALEVDEELGNRCLVLSVDESRQQTKAIHRQQLSSQTSSGSARLRHVESIRRLHHNAQRLLEPLAVYNPYADQLTFPSNKTRLRRDHLKYLSLIRAIALLHQHSRPIQTDADGVRYVNVVPRDIEIAGGMAGEILGRSLDELSPQTRTFLEQLHEFVIQACQQQDLHRGEFRFTRRDVRQSLGWSDWQTRTHLDKLLDLEYLLIHRGKNGQRFVYELLYDGRGRQGQPFLVGLIDPAKLQPTASYSPSGESTLRPKQSTLRVP